MHLKMLICFQDINFEDFNSNCVFQLSSNSVKEIVSIILRAQNKEIANKYVFI